MSRRTAFRRKAAAGQTLPVFRHPFNEVFFDTWSDGLGWLTGLIWSDGALFGNTIEICSKDKDLIETVAALIGSQSVLPKNLGRAWRIIFTSPRVAAFYRSLGLTSAKSLTAPWPSLDTAWQGAFVRGLLDGDGSVLLRQGRPGQQASDLRVSWVGAAPDLGAGLFAWLKTNDINAHFAQPRERLWKVQVSEQASLRHLYSLLYPAADVPSLARKRQNYDQWMVTPRTKPGRPRRAT